MPDGIDQLRITPCAPERIREILGSDLIGIPVATGPEIARFARFQRAVANLVGLLDPTEESRSREEWARGVWRARPELIVELIAASEGPPLRVPEVDSGVLDQLTSHLNQVADVMAADIELDHDPERAVAGVMQFNRQVRALATSIISFWVAVRLENRLLEATMHRVGKDPSIGLISVVEEELQRREPDLDVYRRAILGECKFYMLPTLEEPLRGFERANGIAFALPSGDPTLGNVMPGFFAGSLDVEKTAQAMRAMVKKLLALDSTPPDDYPRADRSRLPQRPRYDLPWQRWWIRTQLNRIPNSLGLAVYDLAQMYVPTMQVVLARYPIQRDLVRTGMALYRHRLEHGAYPKSLSEIQVAHLEVKPSPLQYSMRERRLWADVSKASVSTASRIFGVRQFVGYLLEP